MREAYDAWALQTIEAMMEELRECAAYFEPRAEAEVVGDPPEMTPNAEMVRLMAIRALLDGSNR